MYDDIGRIVTFNDGEYVLVSRINDDEDTYVYLMSVFSPINVLIAKEKELSSSVVELVVVEEEEERKRIYNQFVKVASLGLL